MNVSVKHISLSLAAASLLAMSSCKNSDIEFDDFEYTAVYFASQNPDRTLVMGEDFENDNSLDNQHKCKIGATLSGSYKGKNATIGIGVDNSLCDNLYYDEGYTNPVKPMPSDYYRLASDKIDFNGEHDGYVEVEFTDAYFNDPISVQGAYVIPLKITSFTGVDKVLEGTPNEGSPSLTNTEAWQVAPKNFTLYRIKYMSKYAGYYLRRGKDRINGKDSIRHWKNEYKIEDEVLQEPITTVSLNKVTLHLQYLINNEVTKYDIALTFDDSQNCTISSDDPNIKVTGTGKYEDKGAGKYWGDRERDQLTLSYTIDDGTNKISTEDTLVTQRRGIKGAWFNYYYKSSK